MADSDRSDELHGRGKSPRTYARGGSVSDMARLLATGETEPESRMARRLVMAGVAIAVVTLVALWFLGR